MVSLESAASSGCSAHAKRDGLEVDYELAKMRSSID